MSYINQFFGASELPTATQPIMRRYGCFQVLLATAASLTGTIFVLYIIEKLGFSAMGIIMAIMIGTQFLIDYPSGALGDYIGQRWVLFLAYASAALAQFIFATASTFNQFAVAAMLFGFSGAQASGALGSWLDTNYKLAAGDLDADRKAYGFTMQRISTMQNFGSGLTIFLGGFLASLLSRSSVFFIEVILSTLLAFLFLVYLQDLSHEKLVLDLRQYFGVLKDGINIAIADRKVRLFVLGNAMQLLVYDIWGTLVLMPLYFSYTGSDALAGMLRSIIFFEGVLISIWMAKVARRIENQQLAKYFSVHFILLFGSALALLVLLPPEQQFSMLGFIALMVIFTVGVSLFMPIIGTLLQRISIDLIPSEQRNAIYSLVPSIASPARVVLIPTIAFLISFQGLASGVAMLLVISMGVVFLYKQVTTMMLPVMVTRSHPAQIVAD